MKNKFVKIIAALTFCLVLIIPIVVVGCESTNGGSGRIKVTFDGNTGNLNGNSSITESVDKNSTVSDLDRFIPTKVGYSFVGWSTKQDGSTILKSTDKIDSSTTLYAIWEIDEITLTYNLMGGTGTLAPVTADYGTTVTVSDGSTISKDNYVFDGWYYESTYTNAIANNRKIYLSSDVTIYAKWKGENRVVNKMEYDFANNSYVSATPANYEYGKSITLPTVTDKAHYTFLGWATTPKANLDSNTAEDIIYNGGALVQVIWGEDADAALTIYEVWSTNKYTINYVTNGADPIDPVVITYGSRDSEDNLRTFAVASCGAKFGYNFQGWNTKEDFSGNEIAASATLTADKNYTLYAKWQAKNVAVTLYRHLDETTDIVGEAPVSSQVVNVAFGGKIKLSDYPVGTPFYLNGWYTASDFADASKVTNDEIVMTKDLFASDEDMTLTFYTNTVPANHTIKFYAEDGTTLEYTITVEHNHGYSFADNIETIKEDYTDKFIKTGHTFFGFKVKGEESEVVYGAGEGRVSAIEQVKDSYELVIVYNINNYNITYVISVNNVGGETVVNGDHKFVYNTDITLITEQDLASSVTNRKFCGWNTSLNSVGEANGDYYKDGDKMPAQDIKLYAVWSIYDFEIVGEENKTATFKGIYTGAENAVGEIIFIPEYFIGYKTTQIAEGALEGNTTITQVVMPEGLVVIGARAFKGCSNLEAIDWMASTSVTTIGESAFESTGLIAAVIPDSITSIGNNAYKNCSSITEIYMNVSLSQSRLSPITLGNNVFEGVGITALSGEGWSVLGNDWKPFFDETDGYAIGEGIFANCTALESANFGSTLPCLSDKLFEGCTALVATNAFDNNMSFKHFGKYAFKNTDLTYTQMKLNNNIEFVDEGAFFGNKHIEEVILGQNVMSVNASAFEDCSGLEAFSYYDLSNIGAGQEEYGALKEIGAKAFKNTKLTEMVIGGNIEKVCAGAFDNCAYLAEVVFDVKVEGFTCEDDAFSNCGKSNSVEGNKVTFYNAQEAWIAVATNTNKVVG